MRTKGSKNKPKKNSTKNLEWVEPKSRVSKRKQKHIPDNEIDLFIIICQSLEGMSEDGKKRTMQFINSKYNQYL